MICLCPPNKVRSGFLQQFPSSLISEALYNTTSDFDLQDD